MIRSKPIFRIVYRDFVLAQFDLDFHVWKDWNVFVVNGEKNEDTKKKTKQANTHIWMPISCTVRPVEDPFASIILSKSGFKMVSVSADSSTVSYNISLANDDDIHESRYYSLQACLTQAHVLID